MLQASLEISHRYFQADGIVGISAKTLALAEKYYTFKYMITMKVMQVRYQKRFSADPN